MFLFITKALITMCGTQADLRLCWSHTTKSGYIHLQTCGKDFCKICRDHLNVFSVFIKMDDKTFQFSVKKKTKWKENPFKVGRLFLPKRYTVLMHIKRDHLKVFPVFKFTAT